MLLDFPSLYVANLHRVGIITIVNIQLVSTVLNNLKKAEELENIECMMLESKPHLL